MAIVWLIKTCLNGTYSKARVSIYLSDVFPVLKGLKEGKDS